MGEWKVPIIFSFYTAQYWPLPGSNHSEQRDRAANGLLISQIELTKLKLLSPFYLTARLSRAQTISLLSSSETSQSARAHETLSFSPDSFLASNWSMEITWLGYWTLAVWEWSYDLDTGLWLVGSDHTPGYWPLIGWLREPSFSPDSVPGQESEYFVTVLSAAVTRTCKFCIFQQNHQIFVVCFSVS